ncbi:MAG: hypothetical protein IJU50_08130 [Lachnospiraceae bacterium]|nr:hypothetical protein [Lachnospiraceae bacterium]
MKQEDFPISESAVHRFIEKNTPLWAGTWGDPAKPAVLINLSMVRLQVSWFLPKLLYAKGAQSVSGGEVLALTWRENPLLSALLASFSIRHISLETWNRKHPFALLKALGKTVQTYFRHPTGETLQTLHFSGIPAGYSLYEDILRTSELSTIRSARTGTVLKKTFHLAWTFYALESFLKRKPVFLAIMDDEAYHEGIFGRLFLKHARHVIAMNDMLDRPIALLPSGLYDRDAWNLRDLYVEKLKHPDPEWESAAEELLAARFSGKNGRKIDVGAFSGRNASREELVKELGLDPEKKHVVIMAHTFSDGILSMGGLYFRDYYDWLDKTLSLAETITEVEWVLKPHPTRSAYHEKQDSIENMFERHKQKHLYFFPDEVSAGSVAGIADVILTIGGNAGLEFACLGIPPVIAGKPFYHGFGFTCEPENLEEYEKTLKNIARMDRLSPHQVLTAKRLFTLRNRWSQLFPHFFHDDFVNAIGRHYYQMVENMALGYFESNENTESYNTESLNEILGWMDPGDLQETQYYKRGQAFS